MKQISKRVYSHLSLNTDLKSTNREICISDALFVNNYCDLVSCVSKILFNNPDLNIYYRGQPNDFKKGKKTLIIPSIYRKHKKLVKFTDRYKYLEFATALLLKEFQENNLPGIDRLKKYKEICWSILQHYDICPTPLLDVTTSLRVAASFASLNSTTSTIYLLALNNQSTSISYSTEEELLNIKLSCICPPIATRPHFQEGFLAGVFPNSEESLTIDCDFSRRLVAKFTFNPTTFWSNDFTCMPQNAIYPNDNDPFYNIGIKIQKKIDEKFLMTFEMQEKNRNLKNYLYASNLESEVMHLILSDWDKMDIVTELMNKGYDKVKIEDNYDEITRILF